MDLTNPLSEGGADQGRCGCGMVLFKKLMKKPKFSFFFFELTNHCLRAQPSYQQQQERQSQRVVFTSALVVT